MSFKLLGLTILAIMVVEVLVFVPSVAKFRVDYLRERAAAAQIAALSLTEAANGAISEELELTLLDSAGVTAVVLNLGDRRELILREGGMQREIVSRYDLSDTNPIRQIRGAIETLSRRGDALIEAHGVPINSAGISIAIVLEEDALYAAMLDYARNIFGLSLFISVTTGLLIYLALLGLIVRPVWRIVDSMIGFRDNPQDPKQSIVPKRRRDEIGVMERELQTMQADLRATLSQRQRLASLGEAVSKINHDLRNILATAQLSSDRLRRVEDPAIKRVSDRMITAIDRAITLCERTLRYGRADEAPPDKRPVELQGLVGEVGASLTQAHRVDWLNEVPADLRVQVDPDQLYRMLLNLARNAAQAIEARDGAHIRVSATLGGGGSVDLRLADNGPGLPDRAKEHLFVPFAGSQSKGGTGLGLAIVRELMRAHGGDVALEKSDESGATFCLSFPPGTALEAPRRRRAG